MTSKYDPYWTNRLSQVRAALGRAATGSPAVVELPGLASVGERGSWYGVTEVCGHEVTYGSMAHARSLGRIVAADGICAAGLLESSLDRDGLDRTGNAGRAGRK